MKRYHFSAGNSTTGAAGVCGAVHADSEEQALALFRACLPEDNEVHPLDADEDGEFEYATIYVNAAAITLEDIDEVEEVCPSCPDHCSAKSNDDGTWVCPLCGHTW